MLNPKTGIIDEGEDSYYENVDTEGFDIGFHNKGKGTKVVGGKHVSKSEGDQKNVGHVFNVKDSQIHFGRGDNVVEKPDLSESSWLSKYWWGLLIPVLVAVVAYAINEGRLPILFTTVQMTSVEERTAVATTTPNLANIFLKTNSMLDLDKENFLRDFEDGPVYATGAVFDNINSLGDGFIVRMTVERNAVGCAFSSEFRKDLLLLKKGDKIDFYGIFTGSGLGGYGAVDPWYITDCVLIK